MKRRLQMICNSQTFHGFRKAWKNGTLSTSDPVYQKARAIAVSLARSWNLPPDMAEELLQNALIALNSCKQRPDSVSSYIRQVIRNDIYGMWRKGGKNRPLSLDDEAMKYLPDNNALRDFQEVFRGLSCRKGFGKILASRPQLQKDIIEYLIDCDMEGRVSRASVIRHLKHTHSRNSIITAYNRVVDLIASIRT